MTIATEPPPRAAVVHALLGSRAATGGAAAALALAGLVPQFLSRTLPDISFLLYAAGRVLDGARLYVDILEVNPPLIVWLNVPVVLAARALGVSEIAAYRAAVLLLAAVSIAACRFVLLRTREGRDPTLRRLLLLSLVFVLFTLPRLDWGEREHLTLALTLPYVLLTVVRLQRSEIGRGASWWIGAAAAVGIAIKPHFALLVLVREAVMMTRVRRRPTAETVVIALAGIAYVAAVALATPEYFALVRRLGPAYDTFLHNSVLVTLLLGDGAAVALGAGLLAVALWRRTESAELRAALVAAMGAFFLAAVLQRKGWRYHFYPALALAWVLMVVLALRLRRPLEDWTARLFGAIAGAGAATIGLAALAGCLAQAARPLDPRYDPDPSIGRLIPIVERYAAGQDVMVLSPNMASGFPLTMYAGARWPQRFSNLWPLVAAYDSAIYAPAPFRYRDQPRMQPLEAMLLRTVSEDFARSRPPLVLVLRTGPDHPKWGMRRLDLLEFLRRDARFAALFSGYDSLGGAGQYAVYARRDLGAPRLAPVAAEAPAPGALRAPNEITAEPARVGLAVVFLLLLAAFYRREAPGFSRFPTAEASTHA